MKSYFSQIATRTQDIHDSTFIKPNMHIWPTVNYSEDKQGFTEEEITQADTIVSKSPTNQPNSRENANSSSEKHSRKHTTAINNMLSDDKKQFSGMPTLSNPNRKNQTKLLKHTHFDGKADSNIPSVENYKTSQRITPMLDDKNKEDDGKQKENDKTTRRARHGTKGPSSFRPVRTEKSNKGNFTHNKQKKVSFKEHIILKTDKSVLEPGKQSISRRAVTNSSPKELIEDNEPNQQSRALVPELCPKTSANPFPSPILMTGNKEKRLIIGRLKVEVVTQPPIRKEQSPAVRTITREVKPQQNRSGGIHSKLRFGLGQM